MPSKKTTSKPESSGSGDAGSFELSLHELKRIVTDLEGGELDLTSSLERYEHGIRRLKECYAFLTSAEQRVTQLIGFDAEGNPVLDTFEAAKSEDLSQKQQARQTRRSANTGTSKLVQRPQDRPTTTRSNESVDEFPELF